MNDKLTYQQAKRLREQSLTSVLADQLKEEFDDCALGPLRGLVRHVSAMDLNATSNHVEGEVLLRRCSRVA